MGYTKIRQFVDITEIYLYEKKVYPTKMRRQRRRTDNVIGFRSGRSIKRAKSTFFDLVRNQLYSIQELPVFLTLTYHNAYETPPSLDDSYRHLKSFFRKTKEVCGVDLSYIAVPEYQKRGFVHFHSLVWGLPDGFKQERTSRVLQRLWAQGYLDVRPAVYKSPALAGYLAKYFTKSYSDNRTFGRKAYTTSRNIKRPVEKGSNSLSNFIPFIVDKSSLQSVDSHATRWLGRCEKRIYNNKESS